MLGSSQSISGPNIALNTIMAEELQQFADQLEKSKDFQADLQKLIKKVFTDHQRIIFNGNGYDDAWLAEAEKRGLCNLTSTADALPVYTAKKNVDLFVQHGIYTKEEINARAEIHIENYTTVLSIEATHHGGYAPAADPARRVRLRRGAVRAGLEEGADGRGPQGEMTLIARELGQLTDKLFAATEKLERDLRRIPADAKKAMAFCHATSGAGHGKGPHPGRPAGNPDTAGLLALPGVQRPAVLCVTSGLTQKQQEMPPCGMDASISQGVLAFGVPWLLCQMPLL